MIKIRNFLYIFQHQRIIKLFPLYLFTYISGIQQICCIILKYQQIIMKTFRRLTSKVLCEFDMFFVEPTLRYKQEAFSSTSGLGFISLLIYGVLIWLFVQNLMLVINMDTSKITISETLHVKMILMIEKILRYSIIRFYVRNTNTDSPITYQTNKLKVQYK